MLSVIYVECHLSCAIFDDGDLCCVIYAECHLCYVSFMLSVIYAERHLG
jgi:hypothetical protein